MLFRSILHHEEGVDLVPANLELSAMEFNLVNAMSRETTLKNYLSQVKNRYDYVIIDCMKLNDQLNMIRDNIGTEQEISITYFVPDDKKSGGAYLTHSGIVKKIDEFERKLIMQDETVIPTEQISVIQGEMFKGLYE